MTRNETGHSPLSRRCAGRVDSRGAGRSPGILDPLSERETRDLYECIEWAGTQSWSNGRVGLNGISYFSMNAWQAAAMRPPHLAAVCAWEGETDWYRDVTHHGGIYTRAASRRSRTGTAEVTRLSLCRSWHFGPSHR